MSPETLAKSGTEDGHQTALFAWAAMAQRFGFAAASDFQTYKEKGHAERFYGVANAVPALEMLHATPNGGKRDQITAARLKATGTKAGYPDISLDVPSRGYHGLRIELKRPATDIKDAGKVSEEQRSWLLALTRHGYRAVVCEGWQEARAAIIDYLS